MSDIEKLKKEFIKIIPDLIKFTSFVLIGMVLMLIAVMLNGGKL